MSYKRKTVDLYDIEGDYGQGWEIVTAETTRREANRAIREYRANEPGVPFRIHKVREPIPQDETPAIPEDSTLGHMMQRLDDWLLKRKPEIDAAAAEHF